MSDTLHLWVKLHGEKTRFCWIFRKVTNTSKWKLKLDIEHLKKYLIWNFHLVWPAQFREWSVFNIFATFFYNKISIFLKFQIKIDCPVSALVSAWCKILKEQHLSFHWKKIISLSFFWTEFKFVNPKTSEKRRF